jgi:3-methylfumaryl-CoA hydratase
MAEAARTAGYRGDQHDECVRFDYRLTSPLFDYQGMVVRAIREQDVTVTAVRDIHGRQTASGTLRNASQ